MSRQIDLILHGARGGEENMDLDREALARAERGQASLRIYGWDRPTVSLGKSQRLEDVLDTFPNLPTVSRPSGGGAVLHGFDVTIALAMPLAMLGVAPRRLRDTYCRLITPLAEALDACGLRCHLAEDRRDRATPDCFASAGRIDLLGEGSARKVAGCALVATREAALLHASVPATEPPVWLRLPPSTLARYRNPVWRHDRFARALPAAWRDLGYDVRLAELDPSLPPDQRASAILWNELDPIGVNYALGALDEYDDYAPSLTAASTVREIEAALLAMRRAMGISISADSKALLQRLRGF